MKSEITEAFKGVCDPRMSNKCRHKLVDILFIGLCTYLSNGNDYEDMVEFARQRIDWLKEVLELPNGIPSHDTFNRVFQTVDPQALMDAVREGGEGLIGGVRDKLVCFDGKNQGGVSPRSRGNRGHYILSAWVEENRVCIGQSKVEDKSNEITAIPLLLESLDLEGSTVSIDAAGCQEGIAGKILEGKADYLLAVKGNQGGLLEEVSDGYIWRTSKEAVDETWEYDHGRYETRKCTILPAAEYLSPVLLKKWRGVKTLVKIEARRTENGISSTQTRYYISSAEKGAAFYNSAVRRHWGIENHLHWHLDVSFGEDGNRSRKGNAPQNLNILRKLALQKVQMMNDGLSIKKRRYRASMNTDYLAQIINT